LKRLPAAIGLVTVLALVCACATPLKSAEWAECQELTYPGKLGPRPVTLADRDDDMFAAWCREQLAQR